MIPVHRKGVAMEDGSRALAVAVLALHLSEILFPEDIALEIEAVEPVGSEEGEDMAAVG